MNPKLYKCKHPNCTIKMPILSKGFCPYHRKLVKEKQKPAYKPTPKRRNTNNNLSAFFAFHLEMLSRYPYSDNSQKLLHNATVANICHVIDKGRHKSVSCNLDNAIYLTLAEHSKMDKLLFENNFEKFREDLPNAFRMYLKQYKKVRPFVKENTIFIQKLDKFLFDNKL